MNTQHNRVVQSSRVRRAPRQQVAVSRTNRKVGSRWRAAAVAMSLGCAAASAQAGDYISDYVQLELGIGAAHYTTTDGRWYQEGVPGGSHLTSKPPAFSAGFTGPLFTRGKWGVDWRAEYVNLGRAAADCSCTPDDRNYNPDTHTYVNKTGVPTAYFTGEGRSQGAALTLEPYYWLDGFKIGVEAGAYIHRDSWSEDVAGWQVAGPPQNLHLSDSYWSVAPVVGAAIRYGRFSLSYRHYFMSLNSKSRNIPPLWNDADAIELKVKF